MANNVEYVLSLKDLFSGKIRSATEETKKLERAVNSVKSSTSNAGGSLLSFGNIVKGAIVGSVGMFAGQVFEVGKTFEKYEVGLKTFLGSSEAASKAFAGIKEDAQKTPFEVDSLFKGNLALISAGESANKARENILGLANAISASGGGNEELQRMVTNLQQIKNLGVASAEDIKQFGYAGINIYKLLEKETGKNIETIKKEGVTYDLLTKALNNAGKAGGMYAGAMENAMNTTEGKFSNLKDTITFLQEKIFKEFKGSINGAMDAISKGIQNVSKWIDIFKTNLTSIKEIFQPIIDVVVYAWDTIKGVFASFNMGAMVNTWANAIGGLFYMIKNIATPIISVLGEVLKIVIGIANGIMGIVLDIAKFFGYTEKKITLKAAVEGQTASKETEKSTTLNKVLGTGGVTATATKKTDTSINSNVKSVSGSRPTSININIGKLVEKQEFHGQTDKIMQLAPQIKNEMTKLFMQMMNDSQHLIAF